MVRAELIGRTKQIANNMLMLAQEAETAQISSNTIQNIWCALKDAEILKNELLYLDFKKIAQEMSKEEIDFKGTKEKP